MEKNVQKWHDIFIKLCSYISFVYNLAIKCIKKYIYIHIVIYNKIFLNENNNNTFSKVF